MPRQKRSHARKTTDAVTILDRITGASCELRGRIEAEKLSQSVAQEIYDARTAAGVTQGELAKVVGTTQSAISRLEDADYGGHSLSMLQRIAKALHRRVEIRFVPDVA